MDIYLQGMRDRSMRGGTELAREIKLTDWSMARNLSNRSSGVQIPRAICTCLKRYLYSAKCSWIIIGRNILSNSDKMKSFLKNNRAPSFLALRMFDVTGGKFKVPYQHPCPTTQFLKTLGVFDAVATLTGVLHNLTVLLPCHQSGSGSVVSHTKQ